MALFDKLRAEFIDIIEWTDNTSDTIIWRFPRYQAEIKNGAQLTVRESQLQQLALQGQLTPATMVWTAGIATWAAANTVPDMAVLFGTVPPPL